MIFQHTIDSVLAGRKSQTSRIWRDYYSVSGWRYGVDGNDSGVILSVSSPSRQLYGLQQELAVQPARGAKGVARIRILELAKRDVRDFTQADIAREGFGDGSLADFERFLSVWVSMHDKWLWRQVANKTHVNFTGATDGLSSQFYTALVIRFELVTEGVAA